MDGIQVSSGSIGTGGSLSSALGQEGFSALQISSIERALRPIFNSRYAQAKHVYEVHRSSGGGLVRFVYRPDPFERYVVTPSSGGAFTAAIVKEPLEESIVGVGGELKTSLWESMIRQEVPPEMIYRFAEIFSWRFDFLTEPRQGDAYKMVWRRYRGNSATRDGEIVTAYYKSKDKGELWAFPVGNEFYDADGDSLHGEFLRAPLAYRRISSVFTEKRYHPILRYYRPHHGIDYSAARGTPVVSVGDGVVIEMRRGYNKGLGTEVRVRHAGSYQSVYGHLHNFAKGLRVGSRVKQGQVIGYVGSTGLSTGPHLHFGFERSGQMINFLNLRVKDNRKKVPASERSRFQRVKAECESLLAQLKEGAGAIQTFPGLNR
jgi:hypothetical protein